MEDATIAATDASINQQALAQKKKAAKAYSTSIWTQVILGSIMLFCILIDTDHNSGHYFWMIFYVTFLCSSIFRIVKIVRTKAKATIAAGL